ncbi:MAG: hypothetical protein OEV56_03230 [Dehalococcoidia bacterium]|nr:hypothetical protein [Dehalococcoidia bacterium]
MTKSEKKQIAGILAEIFEDGGVEAIIEHYNGFSDCIPLEATQHLSANDEIGEEIEEYMYVLLAKKYAKFAGGKFVPKAR